MELAPAAIRLERAGEHERCDGQDEEHDDGEIVEHVVTGGDGGGALPLCTAAAESSCCGAAPPPGKEARQKSRIGPTVVLPAAANRT